MISVVAGVPQHGFRVNKCCSEDQALTPESMCTDYDSYYSYSTNEIRPWLPSDVTVESRSLSEFHVTTQFGSKATCEGRHYLVFADDVDLFSLLDDGGLVLYSEEDYGKNQTFPASSFCFDRLLLDGGQTVKVILLCPCDTMTCIRKCCPPGRYLDANQRCITDDTDVIRHSLLRDDTSQYFQLIGLPRCQDGGVYLLNTVPSQSKTHLQYGFSNDGQVVGREFRQPIPVEEYCWDVTLDENGNETPNLLFCKRRESRGWGGDRRVFYGVVVLIDAVFLSATLLVYGALPELRSGLHAKYLMAHTASFLVAHLFLGIGQLVPDLHYVFCSIIGKTTSVATLLASRVQFKSLAPLQDYI